MNCRSCASRSSATTPDRGATSGRSASRKPVPGSPDGSHLRSRGALSRSTRRCRKGDAALGPRLRPRRSRGSDGETAPPGRRRGDRVRAPLARVALANTHRALAASAIVQEMIRGASRRSITRSSTRVSTSCGTLGTRPSCTESPPGWGSTPRASTPPSPPVSGRPPCARRRRTRTGGRSLLSRRSSSVARRSLSALTRPRRSGRQRSGPPPREPGLCDRVTEVLGAAERVRENGLRLA